MCKQMNSLKGHQGFIKKYEILGESKQMRVPLSVYDKIKVMLDRFEKVSKKKGLDTVDKILDKIIDGLDDML
jgi:ribosomal protein S8